MSFNDPLAHFEDNSLFVLVHDGWHAAWEWESVTSWLNQRYWNAVALDLPGHGSHRADPNLSLAAYAQAIADFVQEQAGPFQNVFLVAHGMSGPATQLATEQILAGPLKAKLRGLIFLAGYIVTSGQSLLDTIPSDVAEFYKALAAERPDNTLSLAELPDYWNFNFISDDPRRAAEILAKLQPEPFAPLTEPVTLTSFFDSGLPMAYVSFNDDLSLPPGSFYPGMSAKLGQHRHVTINAGHEAPLTKPREVAESLIFTATSWLMEK